MGYLVGVVVGWGLMVIAACEGGPEGGFSTAQTVDSAQEAITTPQCGEMLLEVVEEWTEGDLPSVGADENLTGLAGPGVVLVDLDGDDWLDGIFALPAGGSMAVRNNGAGLLVRWEGSAVDGEPWPTAQCASSADVDKDGDFDLFLGRGLGHSDLLLSNDGNGQFSSTALPLSEGNTHSGSFADFDGDGDADLFVARSVATIDLEGIESGDVVGTKNSLYMNQGGTFVDYTSKLPASVVEAISFEGSLVDADLDGDIDIYLVNDFGSLAIPNQLLLNDGKGNFTLAEDCDCNLAAFGMGGAVGDVDGDFSPDIYVSDIGGPTLLLNNGDGLFYDGTLSKGADIPAAEDRLASWGTTFVDLNQDTWPDILVMFGQLLLEADENDQDALDSYAGEANESWTDSPRQKDALLMNLGSGFFSNKSQSSTFNDSSIGRAVAVGDLDRDGLPDVVTAGIPYVKQWINRSKCPAGITLQLPSHSTGYEGLGAEVVVTVGARTYTQWLLPGSTYSSSAPELYLGLNGAKKADLIEIYWPSGEQDLLRDVEAGRRVTLTHL